MRNNHQTIIRNTSNSLEELEAWKTAAEVRRNMKALVSNFPENESQELALDVLRTSRSVSRNIAKGFGCFPNTGSLQHYRLARGFLFELRDHLYTAMDEGYIQNVDAKVLQELMTKACRQLDDLIRDSVSDRSQQAVQSQHTLPLTYCF